MTTWGDLSNLATGGGTLILAVATFASVRSANRSARVAEQALLEQRRPVLVQSRLEDPLQKIMYMEGHWVHVPGAQGAAEYHEGIVYLALSLRNVGSGLAVLQGWSVSAARQMMDIPHSDPETMRRQSRDLYVPGGDTGLWQGALRDASDALHGDVAAAVMARRPFTIELLYSDLVGEQRTISRFGVNPAGDDDTWLVAVTRHWYLDRGGPR